MSLAKYLKWLILNLFSGRHLACDEPHAQLLSTPGQAPEHPLAIWLFVVLLARRRFELSRCRSDEDKVGHRDRALILMATSLTRCITADSAHARVAHQGLACSRARAGHHDWLGRASRNSAIHCQANH